MLILIHYNEIGLKGENRWIFEEQFVRNIKAALKDIGGFRVERRRGRIIAETISPSSNGDIVSAITEKLKRVFGIAYFAFAFEARVSIERIAAEVYDAYRSYRSDKSKKLYKTFRIETKRSDKNFPLTSQELNKELGDFIRKKTKMKVDLDHPDIVFFLEIAREKLYIYFEKIKGFGGLPVGVSGRVLAMISSGIDSPVAAWYLMKRGARVDFIHFHSWPQTSRASIDNVKKIADILRRYQNECDLYLAPLLDIQKEIIKKAPEDYRVIMYRYFMFQIAGEICAPRPASAGRGAQRRETLPKALVTGESLGQVASQTLDNIQAMHKSLMGVLPVFRPLIGMNKEEIIKKARQIGTYEFSIKPYDDCCSFFVPKHPVTKAESDIILKIAGKMDKNIIGGILKSIEIINF